MASQKKKVPVRRAKGSVKTRRKGAIRKSLRTRNGLADLDRVRLTIRAHALEAFGNVEKTDHWLHRPNQLFQGRSPLEVLEVDPAAVEAEIVRIEHGVYV
jgi:uncharacterized protein (DUF2384 family)